MNWSKVDYRQIYGSLLETTILKALFEVVEYAYSKSTLRTFSHHVQTWRWGRCGAMIIMVDEIIAALGTQAYGVHFNWREGYVRFRLQRSFYDITAMRFDSEKDYRRVTRRLGEIAEQVCTWALEELESER